MPADCIDPCTQCVTSLTGPGCCPSFWNLSYMNHKVDELCEEKGLLYLNSFLCVLLLWHYNLFTIIKCHFSSLRPHFIYRVGVNVQYGIIQFVEVAVKLVCPVSKC